MIIVAIFFGTLISFSILEYFFSYRKRELERAVRWPSNILLSTTYTLMGFILKPLAPAAMALWASKNGVGLFNFFKINNELVVLISGLLILDLAIYFQHYLFHMNKYLWKLHRVHHTDIDLDASSALRFHPIEILLSFFYKITLVVLLGISVETVIVFEVILSSMAIFNHSNLGLYKHFEKILRLFVVTPQMHIVHHSTLMRESNTNFGFNLSIWDRLFGTYTKDFSGDRRVGLNRYRTVTDHSFLKMLKQPFL